MSSIQNARSSKLLTLAVVLACVGIVALALWGCAPQSTTAAANAAAAEESASYGYPNFTENSSGMFPDTYTNTELLNAGNRGCNACHSDLWTVMNMKDGYQHILTHVGYGKNLVYKDCEPCHRAHQSKCGPYLGDLLHASHYSNDTFLDANGNCWSCHAMNSEGQSGEYQLVLWDDFVDSGDLGGYVDADVKADTRWWAESRGFDGGFITEVQLEDAPTMNVSFDQAITENPDDVFIVNNWGTEVTEKDGAPYSFDEVSSCDTVTISGVNNPRTITLDEIKAMPQVEFNSTIACATNGSGGSLMANIPMTGVPMEYIVEQCGGLVEGVDAVLALGADGWNGFGANTMTDTYVKDAYIVTQYYGEELSADDGPMVLVSRGSTGMANIKHLQSIEFMQSGTSMPQSILKKVGVMPYPINGMWFQNDGNTYKVGEPVSLSGAVFSFNRAAGDLATISLSFDMGATWTDFDVATEIANYDPCQWTRFYIDWTPQKAGTYQVKMNATDSAGAQMEEPITLFLTVVE